MRARVRYIVLFCFLGLGKLLISQQSKLMVIASEVARIDSIKMEIDHLDPERNTLGSIGCGDEGSTEMVMDSLRTYYIWDTYLSLNLEVTRYFDEDNQLIYKRERYGQEYERISYLRGDHVIHEVESGNFMGLPVEVKKKIERR